MHKDPASCSLVQSGNHLEFRENIEGIDEWPNSWPDGEISYRLNNFSSDILERWQTRAITVALRAWKLRINKIWFRRERNPDTHVDLQVWFEPEDHFSSRNVFAHAFFPNRTRQDMDGDVHINDESWDWVSGAHMQDLAHPPLVPVMIHEFGHSLGLRHDKLSTSMNTEIMYPTFNLGRRKTTLGPNDIARIQSRYGARTLSQRILDYFALRRLRGSDFR